MNSDPSEFLLISPELRRIVQDAIHVAVKYQRAVGGKRKLGITGEVGEVLVCDQLNLKMMMGDLQAGYDAIDENGKNVQIKTRRSETHGLPNNATGIFSMHAFDYALLALLDHDYELCEIWRADYNVLSPLIEKRKRRNISIPAFKKVGTKIFERCST